MKENTKLIISIFCIAFLIRFLFLLIMPQFFDRMFHFRDDWIYLTYAKNIISQGIWVPDITRMDLSIYGDPYIAHDVGPGWPLILSLIILLFGENLQIIMFLNVILSSLTCIVIYHLGKEVFNKEIGIMSFIWSTIYVYFMVYIPRVLKENLLQLLIPLVILLMVYEIKKSRANKTSIFFSLAFTYLIHTDERYMIFLPIIFITMIACNNINRMNGLKNFAVFMTAVIVLSIPWTIRNYVVYNRLVILTTRTEIVTNPIFEKIKSYNNIKVKKQEITKSSTEYLDNIEQNNIDKGYFIKTKNDNSSLFNSFDEVFQRLSIYWAPMVLRESKFEGKFNTWGILAGSLKYNLRGMLTFGILLPFFIVGSIFSLKNNKLGFSLILFILIQSLLHIATDLMNPWPRYRYPIDSLIIIMAFYGLHQLVQAKRINRQVSCIKNLFSILLEPRT